MVFKISIGWKSARSGDTVIDVPTQTMGTEATSSSDYFSSFKSSVRTGNIASSAIKIDLSSGGCYRGNVSLYYSVGQKTGENLSTLSD